MVHEQPAAGAFEAEVPQVRRWAVDRRLKAFGYLDLALGNVPRFDDLF
jgi:hypothetical protein